MRDGRLGIGGGDVIGLDRPGGGAGGENSLRGEGGGKKERRDSWRQHSRSLRRTETEVLCLPVFLRSGPELSLLRSSGNYHYSEIIPTTSFISRFMFQIGIQRIA